MMPFTLGAVLKDENGLPSTGLRNFVPHADMETALDVGFTMLTLLAEVPDYIDAAQQEGIVIHYD